MIFLSIYIAESKFIKLSLKELKINNPPIKRILKFHLFCNRHNLVSINEIIIENIKKIPLIGRAVDRKKVPK
tara:strand:- start:191 stop:406 length:216 start_codon:yes stop_codon:yes gene_type:complete